MTRRRPTTAERGYDYKHVQLRRALLAAMPDGQPCAGCGRPMFRSQARYLDLGHDDHDRTRYRGLEHRRCNRSRAAAAGNRARGQRQQERAPMKLFRRPVTYTAVGVEITQSRTATWVALAGAVDDEQAVVELLDPLVGPEAVPLLVELADQYPTIETVALDPLSASATLIDGLTAECVPLMLVDSRGMAVAHGRFLDWTTSGQLRHRGNQALTDAVREAAARRTTSGAQRVDRTTSDPAALVAAELAVLALGDIGTAGGLGPGSVTVAYTGDPSKLPPHLEAQAKQIEQGFPPALPNWPGARNGWARG
jgi:hypothetical protein